jgi:peptidoglycan/xylan/chitin deacetylase (PgdA/CDA1 family)
MNEQFFAREDGPAPGLPRELVGYANKPPQIEWPGGTKVAVQIVVNYEEGSEKTFPMGDRENDYLHELPFKLDGMRDMAVESVYEYGSRAGIWRLFRIFDSAGVPITVFGTAVALERNPAVAEQIRARGDETAAHGYRWSNGYEMTEEEEREAIKRAVASIERTTGARPLGWYSREMSVNTRELVVEEGGFVYDSESYNDDLPYWTNVHGRAHLVLPYSLVVNDCRFVLPQGYSNPNDLYDFAKTSLDRLRNDGDDTARMMSIGLHPRFTGNPSRADALARFIDYAQQFEDVWFARRIDIARDFVRQIPADHPEFGVSQA